MAIARQPTDEDGFDKEGVGVVCGITAVPVGWVERKTETQYRHTTHTSQLYTALLTKHIAKPNEKHTPASTR